MVSINGSIEVNASVERVWDVVSDIDRDSKYWNGLISSNVIRREGNVIEREVKVGFMGHKGHQLVKLNPKTSVDIEMIDGPIVGSRSLKLVPLGDGRKLKLEASWESTFSKVPFFARAFVESQIESVTKEALEKIALEAEGKDRATNKVVLVSSK
jgi:carbon monoxide dehydrogenase subunit G